MASRKVSALSAVTALAGTDTLYIIQGAVPKKVSISQLTGYLGTVDLGYVTPDELADALASLDFSGTYAPLNHNHDGVYQEKDEQLDSLSALDLAGNAHKVVMVKSDETGFVLDSRQFVQIYATATGSSQDITLYEPKDAGQVNLFAGGIFQKPGVDFTVSTDGITLTTTQPAGVSLIVQYLGNPPALQLLSLGPPASILEGSAEDTVVGAVLNTTPGSSLALTVNAGNRFKLVSGVIKAGSVATDYATATQHDITIRETLTGAPNIIRDSVITVPVADVAGGGSGGLDAPTLAMDTTPGNNPPKWTSTYPNAQMYDSSTSTGDVVEMNWNVNGGAWQVDIPIQLTSAVLISGTFDWVQFKAAAPFAAGSVINVRERTVRYLNGVQDDTSPWSTTASDTIEDTVPNAFDFTDTTGATPGAQVVSIEQTITGINAPSPIGVSAGLEYAIKPSGGSYGAYTTAAGTVVNNDTVKLRMTASVFGSTPVTRTVTIGGIPDNWTVTTAAVGAGFAASTNQPTTVSAGQATYNIDFQTGRAQVFVGPCASTTAVMTSVTLDGTPMVLEQTIGVAGTNSLLLRYALDVTAGNHDVFVDRVGTGTIPVMAGTLLNATAAAVDAVGMTYVSDASPHDATAQLDINAAGIGVVFIAGGTFVAWRGGVTQAGVSPDGGRRLGVMSASGTPGYTTTAQAFCGVLAAAFDEA